MDFRFTAHDPQTGAFLHRLPRPEKVQIGDTFGTRGTLDLTFSSKALNAKPMPTFVEIRQEATFDNGQTWAPIGPNYLRLSGSHEDTDQAGMRTVKFVSREWLLSKARVGEGDLPLIDNKRPFYQSSPGATMRTLLLEAKDRGAAQGIEIGGFTAGSDSAGNSWPKVATIYYSPGLPILNVLENLVEQGLCDYRMDGNIMRLYAPETTMGRDLTTSANPVRVHGHVTEAPVNYTLEDLTTSALLIGEDGFALEVDNPSAPDDYGRLEVTIEQGGVNQEGTARIMVDEALNKGSREIREITRTQRVDGLKFIPYRDYRVGDFVQVRDQGAWERYRVREIQLVRDGDGWTVHTVINDRLQELLLKLAKRTNGIVNGSQGSGGDGTPPAPPAKPGIEPAAPEGLIIDQQVYLDARGTAQGLVTASWAPVIESINGRAIEIGGYELWWRGNSTLGKWTRVAATDNDTTVSHSPVRLTSRDGDPMEYQWRVRAVAAASARPGPFSKSVTMTMTQDTEPPPTPSTPTVETDLRIITVTIDGLDLDGQKMPPDYNHTRVYFSAAANMADAEWVGSLTQPGSWNSGSMEPDVPVYVAVTAVDHVGNESTRTPSQAVIPRKLVDDDSIREAVEGIEETINSAKEAAIAEAVITAGGVNVHNKTTPPVASPTDREHDVWQQWNTLEPGGTLIAAWVHDGTRWVERDIDEVYMPRINLGEGTYSTLSGSRIEAESITADKILIGVPTNLVPGADNWSFSNAGWSKFGWNPGDGFLTTRGENTLYTDEPFMVPEGEYLLEADFSSSGGAGRSYVGLYSEEWPDTGTSGYRYGLQNFTGPTSVPFVMPAGGAMVTLRILTGYQGSLGSNGTTWIKKVSFRPRVGATLIQDGAITTDKILANAITAGKIAALAIEADHLAANAVTADKIRAGAIDGKLITGATIRTAASGRRTIIDVEGLRSYDTSGAVTLTTSTQDGSIDMRGKLRQTAKGVTLYVGSNYEDGFPAIQWDPGRSYFYPAGLTYQEKNTYPELLLQGPGGADSYSHLLLEEYGRRFLLRAERSNAGWKVEADPQNQWMRSGSTDNTGPFMYMEKGFSADGEARVQHNHPTTSSFASMVLQDRYVWLGARDSGGNIVGVHYSEVGGSGINAGSNPIVLTAGGGIYTPNIPQAGTYAHLVRSNGVISYLPSSRRYKIAEEPIGDTVPGIEERLLSIEPKTWYPKQVAERYADYLTAVENGDEPERDLDKIGEVKRLAGVIAEDLHDAGLGVFVTYNDDGEPDSVMHEGIAPALIPIIRRLRDRVDVLEQQLGATA